MSKHLLFLINVLHNLTHLIAYETYTMTKSQANYYYNTIKEVNPKITYWIDEIPINKWTHGIKTDNKITY